MDWINQKYEEVAFLPSHFDTEVIALAEWNGEKAGLGRLSTIDSLNFELGGIYVFEAFRSKGIARQIVHFLLKNVTPSQNVYCIPFEHLSPFYQQCGFSPCTDLEKVPKKVLDKHLWCNKTYPQPTSLLFLQS